MIMCFILLHLKHLFSLIILKIYELTINYEFVINVNKNDKI